MMISAPDCHQNSQLRFSLDVFSFLGFTSVSSVFFSFFSFFSMARSRKGELGGGIRPNVLFYCDAAARKMLINVYPGSFYCVQITRTA